MLTAEIKKVFEGYSAPPSTTDSQANNSFCCGIMWVIGMAHPFFLRRNPSGQVLLRVDKNGKGVISVFLFNNTYDKLVGLNTRF